VEADVGNLRVGGKPASTVNVEGHGVNAMEPSIRVGCSQNRRRNAVSAAQIAPGEAGISFLRSKTRKQRHVVQPRWRCFGKEIPDVGYVRYIPAGWQDLRRAG
jgi:hypothetical protein